MPIITIRICNFLPSFSFWLHLPPSPRRPPMRASPSPSPMRTREEHYDLHLGVPDPPTPFRLRTGDAVPPDFSDPIDLSDLSDLIDAPIEFIEEARELVEEASELEE